MSKKTKKFNYYLKKGEVVLIAKIGEKREVLNRTDSCGYVVFKDLKIDFSDYCLWDKKFTEKGFDFSKIDSFTYGAGNKIGWDYMHFSQEGKHYSAREIADHGVAVANFYYKHFYKPSILQKIKNIFWR